MHCKRLAIFAINLALLTIGLPPLAIGQEKAASWTGCYAEASGGYAIIKADGTLRAKEIGVGAGCDYQIDANFLIGGMVRYDFGDIRIASAQLRAGYLINKDLLAYGLVNVMADGKSWNFGQSIYSAGAGVETKLGTSQVHLFGEVAKDLAFSGADKPDSALTFRAGLRYRF